jgi:energy-coupling factor transporter ATP-binding protein EcfA2
VTAHPATNIAQPIVLIDGLTYRYPGAAMPSLRSIDLEIGPGLTLVIGGSGGGKSTLLRLLDGLVPQFHGGRISGSATVAGLDPLRTPIPRLAQRVGLVFQDVETQSVYGTVEREVAFGLENAGRDARPRRRSAGGTLDRMPAGPSPVDPFRGRAPARPARRRPGDAAGARGPG